jgi:hypothetical protein
MQLEMAKVVVLRLDLARDRCHLAAHKQDLCQLLKLKSLGLASLEWTIARQESRLLWLREGGTPMKFFHVQASNRRSKNFIRSLKHRGQLLVQEECKPKATFNFFNERLGTPATRSHAINLEDLDLLILHWEMTVDNKFSSHLVPEQYHVRQATIEFKDFAII